MQTEQPRMTAPLWVRGCLALTACGAALCLFRDQLPTFHWLSVHQGSPNRRCETPVNDRVLSDEVMSRLTVIPISSKRAPVEALLGAPYCQLPIVNVRAKRESQRFLYKQAGDTPWLVVLYEDKEYVGFTLSAQGPQRR